MMLNQIVIRFLICIVCLSQVAISQQLHPGDGVKLTSYNISDALSGDYFVQKNWDIQFPYIGSVSVRNRDFDSIELEIDKKFSKIYREPEMLIQPLYRINVLGEISKPGVYYLTGVEKLSDLLAMAGGETRDSNFNKIYLIRNHRKVDINAREILQRGRRINDFGIRSGDQIYVSQKSWISRNTSLIVSAGAVAATIIAAIKR